jgi:hypothetical protein
MSTRSVGPSAWTGAAQPATLAITITVGGEPLDVEIPVYSINYPALKVEPYDLASGYQAIVPPVSAANSKASYLIIIPPSTNTATITVKGVTGDTAVPGGPQGPYLIPLIAGTTVSVGLTASAAISGCTFIWL